MVLTYVYIHPPDKDSCEHPTTQPRTPPALSSTVRCLPQPASFVVITNRNRAHASFEVLDYKIQDPDLPLMFEPRVLPHTKPDMNATS